LATPPGTLTNVTPLKVVPTIPNATNIQLELLLPIKNDSLFELREVKYATTNSIMKYAMTKENNINGDIQFGFYGKVNFR